MEGERQGEAWPALELRGGTAKFGCGVLLQGVCEPSSSLWCLGTCCLYTCVFQWNC